ncbi:MAG: hypothetical protein JW699_02890 [Chitinispirillaceae bacterium]|nr:hypothetical protein [Chitinispirillaceae bacterium]
MATENKVLDLSFPAGEDLTNDQYRFVVLASDGTVRRPDSATEGCLGILQNAPASGEAAAVRIHGVSKLQANDALGIGTFVCTEYVGAADAGKAADATGSLAYARAVVIEASAAEDDLCSALLVNQVPGIAAISHNKVVATITTAGAATYTAANLVGGLILRDPNGDNRSDVTPTAAQIVGAIAGAVAGSAIEFNIRNTADAAETITVTEGAGVTLSGTMTIAQNNGKRFLAIVTDAGSGTEAVTVYSLGTSVF